LRTSKRDAKRPHREVPFKEETRQRPDRPTQGTGGNNTRPTMGFGGETTARPRIEAPSRSVIRFIPDSPILARDECETFPSAANAGAEERAANRAKTMRVFIESVFRQKRIEQKWLSAQKQSNRGDIEERCRQTRVAGAL
jgi:hypothetical protein